jgi:hypothetical protein
MLISIQKLPVLLYAAKKPPFFCRHFVAKIHFTECCIFIHKKANLLFCEQLWRLLLIYASQPSAKASITSAKRYAVGEYWRIFSGEYSHNPYFREKSWQMTFL